MKHILLLTMIFLTISLSAANDLTKEKEHLLSYIKNMKGEFIRNGSSHTPEKAVSHIIKKYNHYKDDIKTTEQFIELCATKSSLSGKLYTFKKEDGTTEEVGKLLLTELKAFRESQKPKTPTENK